MPSCRIGFVGAGGVAARHARMLATVPTARLVSVCDTDLERAGAFATDFSVRQVPDVTALLETGVDAVYVCVPPFAHGEIEEAVIKAGVALFVEKPLGLDVAVADHLAALLADADIVTAVGHHWRYSAAVREAARLLADRPVRLVSGAWLDKVPPVSWWARRDRSGGQLVEQAVHVLDLARFLVGEVREVYAMTDGVPPPQPDADVDGTTVAVLRFTGGAVGTLAATCRLGWKHRAVLDVCTDDLALTVTENDLVICDKDGERREAVDPEHAKLAADQAFVDAVLGDRDAVLVPYEEALRTHRLACAMVSSAVNGRPVEVSGAV